MGGGGGGSTEEKFSLIQPLKSQKNLTQPQISIKKTPPLAKNFTGYHSVVTHVLYHFYETSLILLTACAIFCSLKFHVVCTCTFFGDTICLLINRKMVKIVIDLHVVLTYDCWCFDTCFGDDNKFLLPNPIKLFCFSFTCNLLLNQNFVYPTLFSSVPHPPS
jgi:hypothetical protein